MATPLTRPNVFGPLVTVLTGFHCNSLGSTHVQTHFLARHLVSPHHPSKVTQKRQYLSNFEDLPGGQGTLYRHFIIEKKITRICSVNV